jgi:hypothetical protein
LLSVVGTAFSVLHILLFILLVSVMELL